MNDGEKNWQCMVCGYIYNEANGIPGSNVAPGTRWEDIPDIWVCPECGSQKDYFEEIN